MSIEVRGIANSCESWSAEGSMAEEPGAGKAHARVSCQGNPFPCRQGDTALEGDEGSSRDKSSQQDSI